MKFVNKHNRRTLSRQDTRVSRVSELVSAIKLVKSNAWELGFLRRINEAREKELASLFKYYSFMLASGVVWEGGVPLTAATTLTTFVLMGGTITPALAFTALSLFDVMVEPCQDMAWIFSQFVVALTSLNRVGKFLETKEVAMVERPPPDVMGRSHAIRFRGGDFGWGSASMPDPDAKEVKRCIAELDKAMEAGAVSEKRAEIAKASLLEQTRKC